MVSRATQHHHIVVTHGLREGLQLCFNKYHNDTPFQLKNWSKTSITTKKVQFPCTERNDIRLPLQMAMYHVVTCTIVQNMLYMQVPLAFIFANFWSSQARRPISLDPLHVDLDTIGRDTLEVPIKRMCMYSRASAIGRGTRHSAMFAVDFIPHFTLVLFPNHWLLWASNSCRYSVEGLRRRSDICCSDTATLE